MGIERNPRQNIYVNHQFEEDEEDEDDEEHEEDEEDRDVEREVEELRRENEQ